MRVWNILHILRVSKFSEYIPVFSLTTWLNFKQHNVFLPNKVCIWSKNCILWVCFEMVDVASIFLLYPKTIIKNNEFMTRIVSIFFIFSENFRYILQIL
jgi:hypothetical protein